MAKDITVRAVCSMIARKDAEKILEGIKEDKEILIRGGDIQYGSRLSLIPYTPTNEYFVYISCDAGTMLRSYTKDDFTLDDRRLTLGDTCLTIRDKEESAPSEEEMTEMAKTYGEE